MITHCVEYLQEEISGVVVPLGSRGFEGLVDYEAAIEAAKEFLELLKEFVGLWRGLRQRTARKVERER